MTNQGGLTEKMQDTLTAIETYIEAHGVSPTVRELAASFGFRGHGSTHARLQALRERGKITWIPHRSRSIQIIPDIPPVACNACADTLMEGHWKTVKGQLVCTAARPCSHCQGGASTTTRRKQLSPERNSSDGS